MDQIRDSLEFFVNERCDLLKEEILIIENEDIEESAYIVRNIKGQKYEIGLTRELCQEAVCFSSRYPSEILYYNSRHLEMEEALVYKYSNHPKITFNNICRVFPSVLDYFNNDNV